MSDLVERLLADISKKHIYRSDAVLREAATALEAQAKELEALRKYCSAASYDYWRMAEAMHRCTIPSLKDKFDALISELKETSHFMADAAAGCANGAVYDDELSKAKARAERAERELDTMNNNHRVMAKLLADTGRERDEAIAALKPFAAQAECWPEIPDNQAMMTSNGEDLSSLDFLMSDLRAARAITGVKP